MEGSRPANRAKLIRENGSNTMRKNGSTRNTSGRIILIAAAFLIGAVFTLPAQQTSTTSADGKEITIEELFLKSVEMQILREKAFSDDYEIKLSALDDLEKKVDTGSYKTDDQQVEFVAEYLALEGSGHVTRQEGRQINDFPGGAPEGRGLARPPGHR